MCNRIEYNIIVEEDTFDEVTQHDGIVATTVHASIGKDIATRFMQFDVAATMVTTYLNRKYGSCIDVTLTAYVGTASTLNPSFSFEAYIPTDSSGFEVFGRVYAAKIDAMYYDLIQSDVVKVEHISGGQYRASVDMRNQLGTSLMFGMLDTLNRRLPERGYTLVWSQQVTAHFSSANDFDHINDHAGAATTLFIITAK